MSILIKANYSDSFATDSVLDSLNSALKGQKIDSLSIDEIIDFGRGKMGTSLDEAIAISKYADSLASQLNYKKGRALALKNIGLGYYYQSDYLNVFIYWEQSLSIYREIGDQAGIANLENNLGAVYFNQGDDASAVENYLRSLSAAESIQDSAGIGKALIGIGNVYLNKEETFLKAEEYYLRALSLFEALEYGDGIGTCAVNLGNIYLEKKDYTSALRYLNMSKQAFENELYIPHVINLIGQVYTEMGNYQEAIAYLLEAIQVSEQLNLKMEEAEAQLALAQTYRMMGKYEEALKIYNETEKLSKELGGKNELKDTYEGIAETYFNVGMYREAFNYLKEFNKVKDTLYSLETDEKIKGLQFTYQIQNKQKEIEGLVKDKRLQALEIRQQKFINYGAAIAGFLLLLLAGGLFNRYRFIHRTNKIIEKEKERSDSLLRNILPEETAEELKEHGKAKARSYSNVTILFTDFKGFTELAATLSPPALVKEINHCYRAFDEIMVRNKVEKIKTIGDAYMAAGGLPKPNDSHAIDVTKAALEIREFMARLIEHRKKIGKPFFEIRIGIHTGPVVAGVVGTHKFAYDIWGDTVNIASRMESNSEPGKINISETTYNLVKEQYSCSYRGEIAVKGAGKKSMYFLN